MAGLSLSRLPLAGKVGMGALLCTLVGLSYYVLLHSDVVSRIRSEEGQTASLRSELSKLEQAKASYLADREELATRQQRQRELNKILPVSSEQSTFLSSLQGVSNTTGVDLKAWSPLDEVPQTFYAKVPMKLQLVGRFHQIAKFIHEVSKQDRIINIDTLELSDPKPEGDDIVLKASCIATTFHMLSKPVTAPTTGAK